MTTFQKILLFKIMIRWHEPKTNNKIGISEPWRLDTTEEDHMQMGSGGSTLLRLQTFDLRQEFEWKRTRFALNEWRTANVCGHKSFGSAQTTIVTLIKRIELHNVQRILRVYLPFDYPPVYSLCSFLAELILFCLRKRWSTKVATQFRTFRFLFHGTH